MGNPSFVRCLMLSLSLLVSTGRSFAQDASGSAGMAQASQMVSAATSTAFAASMFPQCSPTTVFPCIAAGLGVLGGAMGMIMAMKNGSKKNELKGPGFTGLDNFNFDDPNFTLNDLINDPTACTGANANPILCEPGGFTANQDRIINDLNGMINDGKISGADADRLKGILSAAKSKDLNKITAALNANKDLAASSGLSDAQAIASPGGIDADGAGGSGGGPGANGGNSANVAYSGEEAAGDEGAGGAGGGAGGGLGAHALGSLGGVDWNGLLDMLDSKTGRSLTLWQRATRRYQGGPAGKRALMLARMELIRKTAVAKLKTQKGTSAFASQVAPPRAKTDKKPAAVLPGKN